MTIKYDKIKHRLTFISTTPAERAELIKLSSDMRKNDVATTLREISGQVHLTLTPAKAKFIIACGAFFDQQTKDL